MVKTHPHSRFALRSLDELRDTSDVILQVDKTESTFTNTNKAVYLCEVVPSSLYDREGTKDALTAELIKANEENRRLSRKFEKLQKITNGTRA
jgi:hypothetical protein